MKKCTCNQPSVSNAIIQRKKFVVVTLAVSQGSVVEPIVFLIFINDFQQHLSCNFVIMFGDGTVEAFRTDL